MTAFTPGERRAQFPAGGKANADSTCQPVGRVTCEVFDPLEHTTTTQRSRPASWLPTTTRSMPPTKLQPEYETAAWPPAPPALPPRPPAPPAPPPPPLPPRPPASPALPPRPPAP